MILDILFIVEVVEAVVGIWTSGSGTSCRVGSKEATWIGIVMAAVIAVEIVMVVAAIVVSRIETGAETGTIVITV